MNRPTFELHSFVRLTNEEKNEIVKAMLKAVVLESDQRGVPVIYVGHAKTDK